MAEKKEWNVFPLRPGVDSYPSGLLPDVVEERHVFLGRYVFIDLDEIFPDLDDLHNTVEGVYSGLDRLNFYAHHPDSAIRGKVNIVFKDLLSKLIDTLLPTDVDSTS
jgi:hypothetical protein